MSLICYQGNPKIDKTNKGQNTYINGILHLMPSKQTCPYASAGCLKCCLSRIGQGRFRRTKEARQRKTNMVLNEPREFEYLLIEELKRDVRRASKIGKKLAIRLNGTSDIAWENVCPNIFKEFPEVTFYDYTKNPTRCMKSYKLPNNYKLVFSRSESNTKDMYRVLRSGKCGVVVVFDKIPKIWNGRKVVNGDNSDLRFLDGCGIIGVTAKGVAARHDRSGFVVRA